MANRSAQTARGREMRRLSEAFDRGGETIAEFASRHGINPGTFAWWRSQLRRGQRAPQAVELVEVDTRSAQPSRAAAATSAGALVVTLPNGIELRLGVDFDAAALERLVDVLRRC